MKKFDLEEVKDFLAKQGPDTKVYLGADSERVRVNGVWYADYALACLLYTSPSPRDRTRSRMPSSA